MRGGERRVPGAQEPTANREAGEAFDLFDPGFLQHRQGVTPAPTKTNLVFNLRFSPVRRLHMVTVQLPSDCRERLRTSCPNNAVVPFCTQ